MAISTSSILFILSLLLLSARSQDTAHDLLPKYGLPRGLLPDAVASFSISPDTGDFVIGLSSTCYVHFSALVFYEKTITGTISYGKITNIKGIQAKRLFWVNLTGMVAKPKTGEIVFQAGILSETLSAKEFETVPACKSSVGIFKDAAADVVVVKDAAADVVVD